MSEHLRRFEAEIIAGRGGGAMVEIPFSVRDAYGTGGQVRVYATRRIPDAVKNQSRGVNDHG